MKSAFVNIFTPNQKIVIQHFRSCIKNSTITLRLPKTNIKRPLVIGHTLVVFLYWFHFYPAENGLFFLPKFKQIEN
jgi:hypothetical protein